jgi:ABC-type polysaccharide/polyol phosphate transport system ATPase subunit
LQLLSRRKWRRYWLSQLTRLRKSPFDPDWLYRQRALLVFGNTCVSEFVHQPPCSSLGTFESSIALEQESRECFVMDAVIVENGSKNYRIYDKPSDRLKELIFRSRKFHQDFWAVRNVSFRVKQGSTFGVIGENGSGKSTLLQMIAGTLQPTEGRVVLNGRVAALLELGAGFNPEFTGRENVFLNAAILGLTDEETVQRIPEIERFAEIGSFIDQPVKTYSSGMYVRLAFAVSINVDPEILLVDESLSVGDVYFQQRCMRKIRQMKHDGKTILFVSHDMTAIKNLCDQAMWLEHGKAMAIGDPDSVVGQYLAAMTLRKDPYAVDAKPTPDVPAELPSDIEPEPEAVVHSIPNIDHRWGNRKAEVLGVQLVDALGRKCDRIEHGKNVTLRVSVKFIEPISQPIVGFLLRNRLGEDIAGINSSAEGISLPPAPAAQVYTVEFQMRLPLLQPGHYFFSVAVAQGTHEEYVICDWVENAINLLLTKSETVYGYMKFDCNIELKYAGPHFAGVKETRGKA